MTRDFEKQLLNSVPHLRTYAKALTRNQDTANDLTQDVILRLISSEHQYNQETSFRAWATACVKNRFIDLYRREQFIRNAVINIDGPERAVPPLQEKIVFCDELAREFEKLPLIHREILIFIAVNEMSYEDAAKVLRITIGTVRSRLARARAVLQNAIEGRKQKNEGPESEVMYATVEI